MAAPKINVHTADLAALHSLGSNFCQQGDYDQALNVFSQAVFLDPANPRAWCDRGNALSGLNRYAEALAAYDRALGLNLEYHQAWFNRGQLLQDMGAYGNALAAYDRAIAILPDPLYLHAKAAIWLQHKLFA